MPLFIFRPGMKRVSKVVTVLAREGYDYLVDELHLRSHIPWLYRLVTPRAPRRIDTRPERIRNLLERLGGSYIKLGQLLSLRPDLVPLEYCHEFSKLQDEVPPFPFKQAKAIIEKELGMPARDVFSRLDEKPLGSASIGQVHLGTLKKEKRMAVVKVQRPGVKKLFEEDIEAMYFIAHRIDATFRTPNFSATQIVKEFERYSKEELDYAIEGGHIARFRKAFAGSDTITIPAFYPDHSTSQVLTMEYLNGTKLSDLIRARKPFDRHETARKILELSITQLFQMETFHADLHPGNIMLMPDKRLGLLDFGITGTLTEQLRDTGIRLYVALMDGDVDGVHDAILTLDQAGGSRPDGLKDEVRALMEEWRGKPLEEARFTHLLHELLNTAMRHNLHVPPDMMLLGKSLLTAEGTCATIYPAFDVVQESKPYLASILTSQFKTQASLKNLLKRSMSIKDFLDKLPRQTLAAMKSVEQGHFQLNLADPEIAELGRDIDTSSDRISAALMVSSFIIAGALILQVNIGPRYWGYSILAFAAFGFAFLMAFFLIISFFKKHTHRKTS